MSKARDTTFSQQILNCKILVVDKKSDLMVGLDENY